MNEKPLTSFEVQEAADMFFPLYSVVQAGMPDGASTEDTLKVMETICKLAHKNRAQKELDRFGFLSQNTNMGNLTTTAAEES